MTYVGKKPADIIATAVDTTTGTFSGEVAAASLDISGNIDVDGTTNLDVVDIDGAVNFASTLQVDGVATFSATSVFSEGIKIDADNGDSPQILFENSDSVTTDGAISTFDDSTGTMVVVGSNFYINSSGSESRFNTSEQSSAIMLNRNGEINLITGDTGATGTTRLKIASDGSISTPTLGTSNVRIGVNAGNSIQSGGNFNIVIGDEAGTAITTGDSNIAIGHGAGDALTTGTNNVAVGHLALSTEDANGFNVAVGYQSLKTLNAGANAYNVAVGYNSGTAVTTGTHNTLVGGLAGDALTTGGFNTAFGYAALSTEDTANNNTAVGYAALTTLNGGTQNVAVGQSAAAAMTTGNQNTIIGTNAGDAITDSDGNTAFGYGALSAEQQGNKSTAVGWQALLQANRGSSGDSFNVAVGYNAGSGINTGVKNTFIGGGSGSAVTSGDANTILGAYNGNQNSLDIRTSSNNIVISDGDGYPAYYVTSSAHVWQGIKTSGYVGVLDNHASTNPFGLLIRTTASDDNDGNEHLFQCDDSSATRFRILNNGDAKNTNNSYQGFSDIKLKEQIKDASSQWEDIKALTVRKYKMKEDVAKGDSDAHWRLGVIAQELETAGMNGLVDEDKDIDTDAKGNVTDLGTTTKTVKYSILYMKAVKALQEAMTRIETLEAKVATLEGA